MTLQQRRAENTIIFKCADSATTAQTRVRITVRLINDDWYDVTLPFPEGTTGAQIAEAFAASLSVSGVTATHEAGSNEIKVTGVYHIDAGFDSAQVTVSLGRGRMRRVRVPRVDTPFAFTIERNSTTGLHGVHIVASHVDITVDDMVYAQLSFAAFSLGATGSPTSPALVCVNRLSRRGWAIRFPRDSHTLVLESTPGGVRLPTTALVGLWTREPGETPHIGLGEWW